MVPAWTRCHRKPAGLYSGKFKLTHYPLIVALDHLPDPAQAGALSALMQGRGFLIAALPPWIVALLHDLTGGFRAGWILHLTCIAIVTVLCWRLAPQSYAGAMSLPARRTDAAEIDRGIPIQPLLRDHNL